MQVAARPSSHGSFDPDRTPTLESLTGLRGIAAVLVFAYHLVVVQYFDGNAQPALRIVYGGGGAGVMLFFVLSGFVLAWGHPPTMTARRFWLRRIARVYPLHLVGIALALAVGAVWVPVIRTADPQALLANVLLVSAWNPQWWQAGNPVSWSLVCEAFFYALLPLLLRLLERRPAGVLAVVAAAAVTATTCSSLLVQVAPLPVSTYSTPILRLPEFVLGVVTAVLMRRTGWQPPRLAVAVPLAVAGYLLTTTLLPFPSGPVGSGGLTAAGFALLIASLAQQDLDGRPSVLRAPLLVRLGRISFAFYLVHLLVIASVSSPWPDGHPNLPVLPALALAMTALAVTVLLACLLHHLIELPANRTILHAGGEDRRRPDILKAGRQERRGTRMDVADAHDAAQGHRRPVPSPPRRATALVLITLVAFTAAQAAGVWHPEDLGADLLGLALCAAAVASGPRWPKAVLLGVAAVVAWPWWSLDYGEVRAIPLALAAYVAASAGAPRRLVLPVVITAALSTLFPSWPDQLAHPDTWYWFLHDMDGSGGLLVIGGVVVAVLLGNASFQQRRDAESLVRKNEELRRLRSADRLRAVNKERATIAREIHDTVAHHIAAIVIRAQAADRVSDLQPDAARSAVRWIAGSGQEVLGEMRAIVRFLHSEEAAENLLLPSGFQAAVGGLVERVRAAGLEVDSSVETPDGLSTLQEYAIIRVCQEALTNALIHSRSAKVELRIDQEPGATVLSVRDDGGPHRRLSPLTGVDSGGNGLRIMQERASAAGGTLQAGPRGTGWAVTLRVPLRHPQRSAAAASASAG